MDFRIISLYSSGSPSIFPMNNIAFVIFHFPDN